MVEQIVGHPTSIAASMNMGLVGTSKGHLFSWGFGRNFEGNIENNLKPVSVLLPSNASTPTQLTAGNMILV